jgi:hypothetical protein
MVHTPDSIMLNQEQGAEKTPSPTSLRPAEIATLERVLGPNKTRAIVRAVNAHAALVEALEESIILQRPPGWRDRAQAALALAKGETHGQ